MQILGSPPRTPAAIFSQVLDHEPHIFKVAHTSLRMPKPKTFRIVPHQFAGALGQFRWGRCGRRHFV